MKTYEEAYNAAVRKARAMRDAGMPEGQHDVGLEYNALFKEYTIFSLPSPKNRYGHELRCEVVKATDPITE